MEISQCQIPGICQDCQWHAADSQGDCTPSFTGAWSIRWGCLVGQVTPFYLMTLITSQEHTEYDPCSHSVYTPHCRPTSIVKVNHPNVFIMHKVLHWFLISWNKHLAYCRGFQDPHWSSLPPLTTSLMTYLASSCTYLPHTGLIIPQSIPPGTHPLKCLHLSHLLHDVLTPWPHFLQIPPDLYSNVTYPSHPFWRCTSPYQHTLTLFSALFFFLFTTYYLLLEDIFFNIFYLVSLMFVPHSINHVSITWAREWLFC